MLCLILLSQVSTLFHIISFASLFIWKPSITYVIHTCYLNVCGSPLIPVTYVFHFWKAGHLPIVL